MLPARLCLRLNKYSTNAKRTSRTEIVARYGGEFPEKLLNKKLKIPPHMYVANAEIAKKVSRLIEPYLQKSQCDTVMELNPGMGYFTRQLLNREQQFRKILLVESMEHFIPQLQEFHNLYPERVKVRQGDFVSLWKLAYQDKMDHGTRVPDLLQDVPLREFNDDPNMLLFGVVGAYNFFKYLINSLVFQNGLFTLGRTEMILAVPPPIYIHLTCSNEIGYMIYRSTSVLFQILFEYRFIAKVPREQFLPGQADYKIDKSSKLKKVKSINPEYLYLVKIVPRRNVLDLCAAEDLPALWYFVKQNFVSRRNRVIPNMEKWIPGCGPRLIINNRRTEPVQPLFADEQPHKLPQFSIPCTTMNTQDFFPNINIYTQFGDLSASQVLTLFSEFRRWPEYSESSFLASLENTLLKMEAASDESIDGVNIVEEDDIGHSEPALEEGQEQAAQVKPSKKLNEEHIVN